MAALSSIGTLLGSGATLYSQQRARQAQYDTQVAQAQANQAVEVQRQNQLIAQQQAEVRNRQLQLARNIASTRARLSGPGLEGYLLNGSRLSPAGIDPGAIRPLMAF